MPRIDLGNYGLSTITPAPLAQTSDVGAAVASIGTAIQGIAERQMALNANESINRANDERLALSQAADNLQQRIARGEVPLETAQSAYNEEIGAVPRPSSARLDRGTADHLALISEHQRRSTAQAFSLFLAGQQTADAGRQFSGSLDSLSTLSTVAGQNLGEVLRRGEISAVGARRAGVSPDAIAEGLDILRANVARSAAHRDPMAALEKLKDPSSGDPVYDALTYPHRIAVQQDAQRYATEQTAASVMDAFKTRGPQAAAQALATVENSGLDPQIKDDVLAHVRSQLANVRDAARIQNATGLGTVESNIATRTAGLQTRHQVEDLYTTGALTPAERAGYLSQIDRNVLDRHTQMAAADALHEALDGGLPLDPSNADHRQALASAFEQDTTGLTPGVPGPAQGVTRLARIPVGAPAWQNIAMAYAERTRMLPEQALAWIREGVRSPEPRIAAAASQFYGSVNAAAPDALSQVDTSTKSMAATIGSMISAGAEPQRAVETARTNVLEASPELIKRREAQYMPLAKQSDAALKTLIGRDYSGGFFHADPKADEGLASLFNDQASHYYEKTGDINLARELAWGDLKRIYGPTRINGDATIMAFPLERFGVKPEEAHGEIQKFLTDNPQPDGTQAPDVQVLADALTLRQVADALAGQPVRPSYKLVGKSGDLVLSSHGIAQRYSVPSGEELGKRFRDVQAAAAHQAQLLINQAKSDRAFEQERLRRLTTSGLH